MEDKLSLVDFSFCARNWKKSGCSFGHVGQSYPVPIEMIGNKESNKVSDRIVLHPNDQSSRLELRVIKFVSNFT